MLRLKEMWRKNHVISSSPTLTPINRTSCVIKILLPVVSIMNEVLASTYKEKDTPPEDRRFVGIRAEVQLVLGTKRH